MADEEVAAVQEKLGEMGVAEEEDELSLELGKKKKKKSKKVEVRQIKLARFEGRAGRGRRRAAIQGRRSATLQRRCAVCAALRCMPLHASHHTAQSAARLLSPLCLL